MAWMATTSALVGVAKELLTSAVAGKVKEHVGYIVNSNENAENMKEELEKLKTMRVAVGKQIIGAKRKADELLGGPSEWEDKADAIISQAEGNLVQDVSRYCYGKMAALMSPTLIEHQKRGKGYEACVSVDIPAPRPLDLYRNKNLDDIGTHKSCLEDIIKAIKDESKSIIGIYGLGGVGKTTLAKEVNARVKDLFDEVAFTTVSQNIDYERIQKEIGVATKRIMKGDKVLVILDDVWAKLNLEKLSIPFGTGYENCKILLTSRDEEVCDNMEAYKIHVNTLQKDESWILFKRIVGDVVENNADLREVAQEVAEKCGGLPLLLNAVGNALKTRSIQDWKEASKRLREPAPSLRYRYPEIGLAFNCLKLSYDFLNEEAQLCFLLCCMFPEDENIMLETLLYYVVGLSKFFRLESIDDARWRVEKAVEILTSYGLLLNLEDKEYTRMHDVARDVALKIATEDPNKFLVEAGKGLIIASQGMNNFLVKAGKGLTTWRPERDDLKTITAVSLMKNKITELPKDELDVSHLEILVVSYNRRLASFSEKPFKSMTELKVLDMAYCDQSVLRGIILLKNLRVLILTDNRNLVDISDIGELKHLKILILNNTAIRKIPKQICLLRYLRRLEALDCQFLNDVADGVISQLVKLEELRIGFSPQVGIPLPDTEIYKRIVEVMHLILMELRYLDLVVPCFKVIPEDFDVEKLKRFGIQIGGSGYHVSSSHSDCRLAIEDVDVPTPLPEWAKKLIAKKPTLILDSIRNIENIIPHLSCAGFNNLEHIQLKRCDDITSLVGEAGGRKCLGNVKHLELRGLSSLKALWTCLDQYIDLSNLETLYITRCPLLGKLFPVSVAQRLFKLQKLWISDCENLQEVIGGSDGINQDEILLPSLTKISLIDLHNLKSFCSGGSSIEYPSLLEVSFMGCPNMKSWGKEPGRHVARELKFVNKRPLDGPDATISNIVAKTYDAAQECLERRRKQRLATGEADNAKRNISSSDYFRRHVRAKTANV